MKSTLRKIICILTLAAAFSGCAGLQDTESTPRPELLPEMVPESFHFNVRDAATRRYLTTADPDTLPPDRRLEVILLRELAMISAEKELPRVFDRLWETHEEIRELVYRPYQRKAFTRPLVEMYYLLTAGPGTTWQEKTAERLFRETLSKLQSPQLSGYALHFYTLALLKNSKFDIALPFLLQLEHYTEPRVHIRDLSFALTYAMKAGEERLACRLMAAICQKASKESAELPDEELKTAIIALKKVKKLDLVREVLVPVVRENPRLQGYSFVELLREPHDAASGKWQISAFVSTAREDTYGTSSSRSANEESKLRIEVQVIKAGRQSNYMDPSLSGIAQNLAETLSFSSFSLVDRKILHLKIGEKGTMPLSGRQFLRIILRSLTPEIARIEIAIMDGHQEVFHTFIETVDSGVTIIGAPRTGDKVLLLRISTFILRISGCWNHPRIMDKTETQKETI